MRVVTQDDVQTLIGAGACSEGLAIVRRAIGQPVADVLKEMPQNMLVWFHEAIPDAAASLSSHAPVWAMSRSGYGYGDGYGSGIGIGSGIGSGIGYGDGDGG